MDLRDFPRIKRLPPYVFNIIGDLKHQARQAGEDIIDFGIGNPGGRAPSHVVAKLVESAPNPVNHRCSVSRGIFKLLEAIAQQAIRGIRQALSKPPAAAIRRAG